MLKVWIAGASGQIGRALNDVLDPMQIEALNTDLDELDITDTTCHALNEDQILETDQERFFCTVCFSDSCRK